MRLVWHVIVGVSLLLLLRAAREHWRTLHYHVLVHLRLGGFLNFLLGLAAHPASCGLA